MADTAAHLVDHILPPATVRQSVLSLPHSLRYRLAFDTELCSAALIGSVLAGSPAAESRS